MKNCPFCGGEAKVERGEWENPNEGYGGNPYYVVVCQKCWCKSKPVAYEYFNMFSKFTVEDFRRSDLLRAKEEIRYEKYEARMEKEAIEKWNTRV